MLRRGMKKPAPRAHATQHGPIRNMELSRKLLPGREFSCVVLVCFFCTRIYGMEEKPEYDACQEGTVVQITGINGANGTKVCTRGFVLRLAQQDAETGKNRPRHETRLCRMSTCDEPGLGQRQLWNPPYLSCWDREGTKLGQPRSQPTTQAMYGTPSTVVLSGHMSRQPTLQLHSRYAGTANYGAVYDPAQLGDARFMLLRMFSSVDSIHRCMCSENLDLETRRQAESVRRTDQTGFRSQPLPFHTVLSFVSWLSSSGI